MRVAAAIGLLAALGACQTAPVPGAGAAVPRQALEARYVSEGVIEVTAVDPLAISDVEVMGPRGVLTSALSVHREDAAGQTQGGGPPHPMSTGAQLLNLLPLIGIGIGGFSVGSGGFAGGGLWLSPSPGMLAPGTYSGSSIASGAPPPSGLYRSTARVTLDDPAAYQRGWRQATVRVRLGDPRTGPTQDLPAPEPTIAR
jgi:hypothetical protein